MPGELNLDYTLLTPEFCLAGLAAIVLGLDPCAPRFRKEWLPYITAAGLIGVLGMSFGWVNKESQFAGLLYVDNYTTFFRVFFTATPAADSNGTEGLELGTLMGLVLVLAGLGFKVAAVPFHMWTPDAYEGAPLPITAYLSATSKAAGFALLLRLFSGAFLSVVDDWQWMIAGLSAITMVLGNLVALQQHNIKRLLAYSSIGQVGYMLMALAALSSATASALLLHMAGYVITNLAAFTCIIAWYNLTGKEEIGDFRGMAERASLLAASVAGGP